MESNLTIHFLLRLLYCKFGAIPDDLQQQLQQIAEPEQSEKLIEAVLDSATLDDFRTHR